MPFPIQNKRSIFTLHWLVWLRRMAALAVISVPSFVVGSEGLDRGLVAIRQEDGSVFLSWQLRSSDTPEVTFELLRHQPGRDPEVVGGERVTGATNLVDRDAPSDDPVSYSMNVAERSKEAISTGRVVPWASGYLEIPISPIPGYRIGDASVGDLDGDGQLDIVLHQVSRPQDNSFAGVTGTPILDAYTLEGTHLWRIDLGKNIREGEHYTQFLVYDLDGNGTAEVACKTADGTADGLGNMIGDAQADWRTLDPDSKLDGRILSGPEYFTVFDGRNGAELATVDYVPSRDPIDGWGGIGGNAGNDDYGNRCDRFLACVAYLDGKRPSAIMCRGVYGRTCLAAWDYSNGELTLRWLFDSGISYPPYRGASPYSGMGGHGISVADVDQDGRDEIICQAMVIDDDGTGLYSTGLRHGDAMYVGDLDPARAGLEVFTIQENEERASSFQTPGVAFRDAKTGKILWSHGPTVDVGQGMAADVDPRHLGHETWGGPGGLRNARGEEIGRAPRETSWTLWWDGDPLRELLSVSRGSHRGRSEPKIGSAMVLKWNWEREVAEPLTRLVGVGAGRGPSLVGDILGDWREEVLLAAPDGRSLRLFSTTIPTNERLPSLPDDRQYRLGLVWQNVCYNRPCYPSYYVGAGMDEAADASDAE